MRGHRTRRRPGLSDAVAAALAEAQRRGFLGPAAIAEHITHALGFAAPVNPPPGRAIDLGSGGGVPGLVLAEHWAATDWVFLDSERQRCDFLETVIAELGWGSRVVVKHARAEDAGRDPRLRGRFDLVTARSFGPPGAVAECAAPFLRLGGELIVSDPPSGGEDRWPAAPLLTLGLAVRVHTADDPHLTVLTQVGACPERFPRRPAPIAKRPLF